MFGKTAFLKTVSILSAFALVFDFLCFFLSIEKEAGLDWEDNTICVQSAESGYVSYPRMYTLNDGALICGYDRNGEICSVKSYDDGLTWESEETHISCFPELSCANSAFIQLESGEILCAYRATGTRDGKFYSSLQVSSSLDNGETWKYHSTIIEALQASDNYNGVWEPHFGFIGDTVAVFYSNDSLTDAVDSEEHQNIEYKLWDGSSWGEKHIASDGNESDSRDGMPVWFQSSCGKYVLTMEATSYRYDESNYRSFVIQMMTSDNGLDWSNGKTIYMTTEKSGAIYAGAPYVVELPDGRLCVSFQTDEGKSSDNSNEWTARVITTWRKFNGNVSSYSFTKPYAPFGKDGISSWNGMLVHNNYLLVFTAKTDEDGKKILLRRAVL